MFVFESGKGYELMLRNLAYDRTINVIYDFFTLCLQGSDASSVIFASTPASRKHEFPGALPPSLPSLNNGTSSSPVPAPTPPNLPVPSPAPAQQPPHHPPQAIPSAAVSATPVAGGGLKPPPGEFQWDDVEKNAFLMCLILRFETVTDCMRLSQ